MTQAICFNCGITKFGAFTPCPDCEATPQSEDEVAVSLLLTDHYMDMQELANYGRLIRDEGKRPQVSPEQRDQLVAALHQTKQIFSEKFGVDLPGFMQPRPFPVRDPSASADYLMPRRCVRCGIEDPGEEGHIVKRENNRLFRFFWERSKLLQLTVPACAACKQTLDRHTAIVRIVGAALGILLLFILFVLLPQGASWVLKLLIAYWGWALGSRLITALYKKIVSDDQGVTWTDLCIYAEDALLFRQPHFHQEFLRVNARST